MRPEVCHDRRYSFAGPKLTVYRGRRERHAIVTDITFINGFLARTNDMIGIFGRFARSAAAGCLALAGMFAIGSAPAQAAYVQNFDVVVPAGWAVANNNNPVGSIPNWYQGVDPNVDPLSFQYLEGTEIDYVEGVHGSGFKFINPSAKTSCGCGSSFSA